MNDELGLAAKHGMMLDAVADAEFARLDHDGLRQRVCEIEKPDLGSLAVAAGDHAVNARL